MCPAEDLITSQGSEVLVNAGVIVTQHNNLALWLIGKDWVVGYELSDPHDCPNS